MKNAAFERSVLFADIAGSSKIYELLGDDAARRRIMDFFGALQAIVQKYNGEFQRTYGDELMCAFKAADDAVAVAAEMHQYMDRCPPVQDDKLGIFGLYIRIDTGAVVREGNKIFGNTVNFAANMKKLAKPLQTLISETTRNSLSQQHKNNTRFVGNLPIKGKPGTYDIFEYLHEVESITIATHITRQEPILNASLELRFNSVSYKVDEHQSVITIGRLPANDIVLKYPGVSRMHAQIKHRKGKFVLVDVSSNGTIVQPADNDSIYVKHDELLLSGEGIINPMSQTTTHTSAVIHFVVHP